jgi:RNA polymerase sigma-70 factor (ECF subfamily)
MELNLREPVTLKVQGRPIFIIKEASLDFMTTSEYNQCVDEHADGLYRFILRNIRDEEDARDVVQDAFEKMWKNVKGIDASKSKSYLFTTAYHTMIDKIRKNKRVSNFTEVNEESLFHTDQYSDLKQILNNAINLLPVNQKAVLTLRDLEGYNYDEIGSITGLSASQVKVYIYRARLFLKDYIGNLERVL